jgi:hypothetical protein
MKDGVLFTAIKSFAYRGHPFRFLSSCVSGTTKELQLPPSRPPDEQEDIATNPITFLRLPTDFMENCGH